VSGRTTALSDEYARPGPIAKAPTSSRWSRASSRLSHRP